MSPGSRGPARPPNIGLHDLAAEARRDFERLRYPAPTGCPAWQARMAKPALDVLVIGGGMCGQTLGLALARDGIANACIIDRAPRGQGRGQSGARGALGHLCAHGHAALSQAIDRARPRLPGAHLPCLVRGPARLTVGSASPRSPPPIGLLWCGTRAGIAVENGVGGS